MKTVSIIVYHLGVGGAEQTIVGEVQEFLRRGFRVELITLNPEREKSLMSLIPPECERIMIPFSSLHDLRAHTQLRNTLRETKPDLIITQMWYANTVGRIAARRAGLQDRVYSFEQNVYDRLKLKTWKQFLADRFLQRWCRRILAASGAIGESLVRSGIDRARISVVYDSVNVTRIREAVPSTIREELGIKHVFTYLFVGRLVPQKGVDILLRAFAQQESGHLLIAGQGEERAALESLARELAIGHRVTFLGVRSDVPAIMKVADCFVLASRLEGLGLVLVEALASALPVVATRVDGIPEVIQSDAMGTLVPPEDSVALAEAMKQVREARGIQEEKHAVYADDMQRLFSIEAHVDSLLALAKRDALL